MPTVQDQNIPSPNWYAYQKTFAPTVPNTYPGGTTPSLDEIVKRHYPDQIEPPNVPSGAQSIQRYRFKTAANLWSGYNSNERRAWNDLAWDSGLWGYPYWMRLAINDIINGGNPARFGELGCAPFMTRSQAGFGYLACYWDSVPAVDFEFKLTIDPATYEEQYRPNDKIFYMTLVHWDDPDPEPDFDVGAAFGPPDVSYRATYHSIFQNVGAGLLHHRWSAFRQATSASTCILWRFAPSIQNVDYEADNWLPPIEPG